MPYQADLYFQAYHADDIERKPLVLIHGAGGDHLSWPTQIRRLSEYRVYTPDLPGHGKSRGHGLQRITAYGEVITNWLYELELPKIFLCGHSMGGAIALWLSLQIPELIQGVILVGTGARLPVNLTLIEELASPEGFPTAVGNICRWSFSPNADPKLIKAVKEQMLKTRPSVLHGDYRACDNYDLSHQLGEINIPTLVMVGKEDKMTPVRFAEELQDGISEAELQVVPEAGHMLPLEKPQLVADLLRSFLDRTGS